MAVLKNGWLHCMVNCYSAKLEKQGVPEEKNSEWLPFSVQISKINAFKPFFADDEEVEDEKLGKGKAAVIFTEGYSGSFTIDISPIQLRSYLNC